jgi:predicted ribosome quality control (RQC) complex YloA/Tae2 family protein
MVTERGEKSMNKLEERLEEAYNDLEETDRQYDEVTQQDREKINYLIQKRQLICDRIRAIKKEAELNEKNTVKMDKPQEDGNSSSVVGSINFFNKSIEKYFVR